MIIRPCARLISTSAPSSSRYDAKVFREPISDREQVRLYVLICVLSCTTYTNVFVFQLRKPLSADDERNFLFIKALKSDETPTFYRNHVVDKLVRVCMTDGRKVCFSVIDCLAKSWVRGYKTSLFFQEMSRKNVLAALEIIKRKQYQAWNKASDDEKVAFKIICYVNVCYCQPKIELSAFKIAEVGIDNCKPLMKLQGVTRGTLFSF